MSQYAGYPGSAGRSGALPLLLAGAAFVVTLWLLADRAGWLDPGPAVEPRPVTPRGDLTELEKTVIEIFEQNRPSVVHITTERIGRTYWGDYTRYPEGTGTGFLWDDRGTIVTNFHVVQNVVEDPTHSRRIHVAMDQGDFQAVYVNGAPGHDIAVLRLIDPPGNLRPMLFGTSSDLEVGQMVLAIGNPFGLDQTLTTGIVSALNRSLQAENGILNGLIQTDAAINPGNSGGPLLDSAGRLIGMNTAIYSPSGTSAGIGFAVPVDTINAVVPALLAGEDERRLGILTRGPVRWRTPAGYLIGIPIEGIQHGSSAEAAGLQPFEVNESGDLVHYGDLILEIAGVPVRSVQDILRSLKGRPRGEKVPVKVLRTSESGGRILELQVEVR